MNFNFIPFLIPLLLALLPNFAFALRVVTSTTDVAWLVQKISGNEAEVESLLKGTENPHFVDTLPQYVQKVSKSDIVCIVGLDLEVGWIPKVLSRSGNAQVQPGGKGYCEVSKKMTVLEKKTGPVDRSMGDIHPSGNPHFWLSPLRLKEAGLEVLDVLARVKPEKNLFFEENYKALSKQLDKIHSVLSQKLKHSLPPNTIFIEYHKEFVYFFDAYSLKSFGSIEEKPGIPPSAGRLSQVSAQAKNGGVRLALAGEFANSRTLERFQELSGVPFLKLPTSLLPHKDLKDYEELQRFLVNQILSVLTGTKNG